MFSCCHAAASPETEEVFAPSLLEGYASSKASKDIQSSGYAAPAAFGFKDGTPGTPHVVLSTKFREHWTEVSKQVKTELEKLGVTVYNPNVDNEMMYGKDEGDARWLRTFQDNLKQVKETKGFVLQIQQGANREKTHMQVAEQDMSMWLGVPRIAIYVLACNDLEYFQRTPDHFDSPYWTHVFEVAMEKAQAQWSTKMKEDLEMANELLEPLEGTELPMKDGLVHGKARSTYADGQIYVGDFEENLKHGRGKMTEPDGASYDGQWVNDQCHGSGVYRGGDGNTYEGQWANDQQHGSGLSRFANGDSYEGEFAHHQRHGRGLYYYVDGDVDAQLAEESRPKDIGVRRLAGGGYQKLQDGAVVKEVTEKEAKQLVKENGLPSLW